MKKLLAILLALAMVLSFAACGGGDEEEETKKSRKEKTTEETTEPEEELEGEKLELDLFTLVYDPEVWEFDEEDDVNTNETWSKVTMTVPDGSDDYITWFEMWASNEGLENFREYLQSYGFDAEEYVDGEYDTVELGGVEFLKYEAEYWGEASTCYVARDEGARITAHIEVLGEYGDEAEALLEGLEFTFEDEGNEDIWPWEGEPFEADDVTETVGSFTVESVWVPFEDPFVTFETFDNSIAVVGDQAYILSCGKLYTYDLSEVLELSDEMEVSEDHDSLYADENGVLWLSGFMADFTGLQDGEELYNFGSEFDSVAIAPNGQWGVSWFSGPDCKLLTIGEDVQATDITFSEVDTISHLNVDNDYIYVCGSDADYNHHVYVYDKTGKLIMTLAGEDGEGLGSVTFVAKVNGGFMGLDGNLRDVVFWDASGNWAGSIEDGDLFGTYYPWFCGAALLEDGSVLVVMTEDRADESAMELVAFKVTVK